MFAKIENEIKDFTKNINHANGCDELLVYMGTDYFSSIKLLMSLSRTFSTYIRVLLFLVITSTALLMSSTIDVIAIGSSLLVGTTLFLSVFLLIYISYCKKVLMLSLDERKSVLKDSKS